MIYIFYVMAFFAVFKLRKQNKGMKRAYSVPLYPLTPIIAIIGSFFVLISTMITDWQSCLISMLIGIAGLPIYYYMKKTQNKAER